MKLRTLYTITFVFSIQFLSAQSTNLDPEKWADELGKKDRNVQEAFKKLFLILQPVDTLRTLQFLDELEGKGKGNHFQVRFKCLKARAIHYKYSYYTFYQDRRPTDLDQVKKQLMDLYSSAMDLAYRSEDDFLVADVSYDYGSIIGSFGEVGLAVMYTKNGIDLFEKLSYPVLPQQYQFLAELLYKVREYNECIRYAKKAVATWPASTDENKQRYTVNCMNTVALGYHRQELYDSAFIYYNQALQLAQQANDTVWAGIVSGNMGQLFYAQGNYDSAYALLKGDYKASKKAGLFDNAANSLQWAARTNLALGNKSAALAEVREAFQLLKAWPDAYYLRNAYYTSTQIFREMGIYDSAFYYNNLWSGINDSLEKVVATSSLAISKARLNDETSRYNIQTLNREKKAQLLQRNIIIIGIAVLSIIIFLIINRKLLQTKLKVETVEQEKKQMEQDVISANEQLKMFTANLVEKTNLIEKLESQAKGKQVTSEQQAIISELSRHTILTEEDWLKFKSLFEKIHPGFFINLQEKVADITVAELRMAALTRLHLSTNQIASTLGISPNSVYKTKQRLRQRLSIEVEDSLEEAIAKM